MNEMELFMKLGEMEARIAALEKAIEGFFSAPGKPSKANTEEAKVYDTKATRVVRMKNSKNQFYLSFLTGQYWNKWYWSSGSSKAENEAAFLQYTGKKVWDVPQVEFDAFKDASDDEKAKMGMAVNIQMKTSKFQVVELVSGEPVDAPKASTPPTNKQTTPSNVRNFNPTVDAVVSEAMRSHGIPKMKLEKMADLGAEVMATYIKELLTPVECVKIDSGVYPTAKAVGKFVAYASSQYGFDIDRVRSIFKEANEHSNFDYMFWPTTPNLLRWQVEYAIDLAGAK